jgi:soluble lytic murein transglycosylase-like protein
MRRQLAALLGIAIVSGFVAGTVANAKADGLRASLPRPKGVASPPVAGRPCPMPERYRKGFRAAARDSTLPVALLLSMSRVESNVQHSARSAAGAIGLLQVMPGTAAELELDPDHPEENILAGARYLRKMLDRFKTPELALAAYNAGPSAVEEAGGAPGAETIAYVANVNRLWRSLHGCS